jgi:hypothetical protein
MPKSRQRKKTALKKAEEATAQQEKVEAKKLTPQQYMRRRFFGWSLVALAVVVGVTHWLAHLGALYQDTGLWDLTIGYPMAAVLGMSGAIVLSK